MPFKPFTFTVPSLPKPVYDMVRHLSETHRVSQWHVVVAGVTVLARMEETDLRALIASTQATYTQ